MIGNLEAFDRPIERLSSFDAQLEQYAIDLMESPEVEEMLSRMNVDQLNEGKRADGSAIDPAYARSTVEIKKEKGQEYNFVTLRDTGGFQGAIRAVNYAGKVKLMSDDPKSDELQAKYLPTILGIDDPNVYIMRDFLRPKFLYFTRRTLTF